MQYNIATLGFFGGVVGAVTGSLLRDVAPMVWHWLKAHI
jgi:hypothetical protein